MFWTKLVFTSSIEGDFSKTCCWLVKRLRNSTTKCLGFLWQFFVLTNWLNHFELISKFWLWYISITGEGSLPEIMWYIASQLAATFDRFTSKKCAYVIYFIEYIWCPQVCPQPTGAQLVYIVTTRGPTSIYRYHQVASWYLSPPPGGQLVSTITTRWMATVRKVDWGHRYIRFHIS